MNYVTTSKGVKIGAAYVSRPGALSRMDGTPIAGDPPDDAEPRFYRTTGEAFPQTAQYGAAIERPWPSLVRRLLAALRQHFSMACCMRADCRDRACPGVAIWRVRGDLTRALDQRRGDR